MSFKKSSASSINYHERKDYSMILYDTIDIFVFIIRGTKTACFDPDSDLLNDKYLENNNCKSFGKSRESFPTDVRISRKRNFRLECDQFPFRLGTQNIRCFAKNIFQYFPICPFNKPINKTMKTMKAMLSNYLYLKFQLLVIDH